MDLESKLCEGVRVAKLELMMPIILPHTWKSAQLSNSNYSTDCRDTPVKLLSKILVTSVKAAVILSLIGHYWTIEPSDWLKLSTFIF